jgi:hypothetical protein
VREDRARLRAIHNLHRAAAGPIPECQRPSRKQQTANCPLEELARRFSIEERLFRDYDTRIDVQLHATDRRLYRDALHDTILAMRRAKQALVAVVQRA